MATDASPVPPPSTGVPTPADAIAPPARAPRGYLPAVATASFGIYLALFTPVMVTMAFKVRHVAPATEVASLGLVLGVGALFALVANPLFGRLSDRSMSRYGRRRPFVLGGTVVGALGMLVIGSATNVATILVAWCVVQAGFNAALSATTATLPDQVPVEGRGKVSGVLGITTPVAILTGSVIANVFAADVARFAVPAVIAVAFAVVLVLTLKDTPRSSAPTDAFGPRQFFGSFVFDPRKHPDFGWVWLTKFLVMFGYAGIATYLPFYLTDQFDLTEAEATGAILIANVVSVAFMMVSAPLGGILSDKLGKRRPFVAIAGGIMVVGLLLLALAPTLALVYVAQGIIGLGAGSFLAVDQALASQVLPDPDDTAKDLGVLNIANALPQSIAPAVAPAIIAFGTAVGIGGYQTWYLFGALVSAAGAVLVYRIKGVK